MSVVRSQSVMASTSRPLVFAAVLLGALVACTANPGGAGSPAAQTTSAASSTSPATGDMSLAPAQPAEPPPGACLTYSTVYDKAPSTMAMLARISTDVVNATAQDVGPARWRTEDEAPPSAKHDLTGDRVMRLVRFSVDQDLAGKGTSGSVVVWIPGGSIGCHNFKVEGLPVDLKAGDQFVLFLNGHNAPIAALPTVPQVMEMWPVEGTVATSVDLGKVNFADLSAAMTGAVAP
jgi:hypothetical protein